jgi:hypothetical protein
MAAEHALGQLPAMQTVVQYRDAARRIRDIAGEPVHHQLRHRLLQVAHELEQEADVREDVARRIGHGEGPI